MLAMTGWEVIGVVVAAGLVSAAFEWCYRKWWRK